MHQNDDVVLLMGVTFDFGLDFIMHTTIILDVKAK